jgi:hypothetical protein
LTEDYRSAVQYIYVRNLAARKPSSPLHPAMPVKGGMCTG